MKQRKLLWVGDAACGSGFARCTHRILDVLQRYWDIHVVGINYRGDPHPYPYPIYPAFIGKDLFGFGRTKTLAEKLQPDVIVLQNDPWNIPAYLQDLKGTFRTVASLAVDGKNCRGRALNDLHLAIFWTEFGRRHAIKGGYHGPSTVIPLGVDIDIYCPMNKWEARELMGIPNKIKDAFIVGNVNRNQLRKRLDLTIQYFAEWIKLNRLKDVFLYLHVAPTGDAGIDCSQLAEYYGVDQRLILAEPDLWKGLSEERMRHTYNCFDVQVSTTQGEGWGLCTAEGMACGIPQVVPAWSALAEWTVGAALQVPCLTTATTPDGINAIGGVVDKELFIDALDSVYRSPELATQMSSNGQALVCQPQYRWEHIGLRFAEEITKAIYELEDREVTPEVLLRA